MLQRELNFLTLLLLLCQNGVKAVDLITCEGETAKITCAEGTIQLLSANYGRTDSTTCSSGKSLEELANTACTQSTTLSELSPLCVGQTNCSIDVGDFFSTDPCPGTYKYLTVSYECAVTSELTARRPYPYPIDYDLEVIVICQYSSRIISCGRGRSLYIYRAIYGKCSKRTCPHHRPGAVSSTFLISQTQNLRNWCNGRRSCDLHALIARFPDPCPNFHMCLEVTYSCRRALYELDNELLQPLQ